MLNQTMRKGTILMSSAVLALTLAACGQKNEGDTKTSASGGTGATAPAKPAETKLTGEIKIDGSSTVFPISSAVAEEFMKKYKDVKVSVGESGSGNGIKKLIGLEIDIANSSRKMKDQEIADLKAKNDDTVMMPIALDGITVVVHKDNTWAKEMTVAELKKIWDKDSKVKKWSDVREGWPADDIKLFGPGTASGTFEYFTEAINGVAKVSRTDYTASEDDNVLVKGVSGDKNAMGYFGFSYYEENKTKLNAVGIKVDDASPAVLPSHETIEKLTYKPLSREIYIYPLKSALQKPQVKEFIKYYNSADGQKLVEEAKYIKLAADKYTKNLEAVK
ncbi:PstS family phosphate ABC transporter substrate-binding protein [Paenibacillus hemerocallicola]|uniref:PstS family phosphate ABC transporter substrate-binding protein n=1 Tax=Paenibacillus hemerocallicola TaxID=1172614 RepID=UPI001FE381B9|nr:PstS family phosphate ABC transporter substrate-binding protein [Paenibacillus hemerocallicola]